MRKLIWVPCFLLCAAVTSAAGQTPPPAKTPSPWQDDAPRITLNTANEDLRTVLDAVAEQCAYNIVVSDDVEKSVTVRLRNVTLTQALDSILLLNGLRYVVTDHTILVFSPEKAPDLAARTLPPLEARVFDLQYVTVNNIRGIVENLLGPRGKLMVAKASDNQGWSLTSDLAENGVRKTGPKDKAGKEEDNPSYHMVVLDEPSHLAAIERVVGQLDVPRKQVYISALIFEMNLNDEKEIGFRWRISNSVTGSALPWNFPFGRQDLGEYFPTVSPSDPLAPSNSGKFPDVSGSSNADGSGGANPAFLFGRVDMTGNELLFELNQLGANLNIISKPSVMVSDQQEAEILVGEKFPILKSSITDYGTLTESFDRYEPIGIQLRVVPHILLDGTVEMLIHPKVTNLGSLVVGTTGLTTPRINSREVDSKVTVEDGESIVIAGLVNERESETITRVPYLSDIPLVGRLFRHRATKKEKIDLVVIVTPYVAEAGRRQLEDQRRAVKNMGENRTQYLDNVPPAKKRKRAR